MINKSHFTFALIIIGCMGWYAGYSRHNNYSLSNGLVLFQKDQVLFLEKKSIEIYNDSNCTDLLMPLTQENTTCPKCFMCAEPASYYNGPLQPFMCYWTSGLGFVCFCETQHSYGIYITDAGAVGYVPKAKVRYYTWDSYMKGRAQKGEYMQFRRPDDSTVLYNKPYPLDSLPVHSMSFTVNVNFKALSVLKFYPVLVDGYWMKLRAMQGKKIVGYCWIIWRSDRAWLKGFMWRG